LFALLLLNDSQAQSTDDLFKKVFGKSQESKVITIDATIGDLLLGGISATVVGENIQSLSGADLERLLLDRVREEKRSSYRFGNIQVGPDKLPFKIRYSPADIRLFIDIPAQDLAAQNADIFDDLVPYFSRKSVDAAPFSFATNYKLEETITKNLNQKSFLQANVDTFSNIKSVTVENQMNYLSNRSSRWYRQNSKLIHDLPVNLQRVEAGDVTYPLLGYQQSLSMGGISFYRDFNLNPYLKTGPTSSFEFEVVSRSLVKTYINNTILKTEYMNPGRYSIKDIPLNNGVNKIVVDITDEFGKKKILIFDEAGSVDLIRPGVSRYSLAAGYPSTDEEVRKKYEDKDGAFMSAFYQYGVNKRWTAGTYFQGNKNYNLAGLDNIIATPFGNFGFDAGGSKNESHSGPALLANYQLNLFGSYWYETHTFNSRVEYRSPWFNEAGQNIINRFDLIATASYSIPLLERFNIAFGGNYHNPRVENTSKYGFDTSLSSKLFDSSSLTFYYARNRDENKLWASQLYFFLNITFGESGTFASTFYETVTNSKRLNLIHDTGSRLNNVKVAASADDNKSNRLGSLDLQYNTTLADLGIREEINHTKGRDSGSKTAVRFLSAFAFVYNGTDAGFSISRPIANSFVLFKPNSDWIGQRFGVQSTGGTDTESGLFGESLVSGLTPYQYRQLQLDPSFLDPGYTLGQESFVVYPRYRSGHLFTVGKSGLLVLRGVILDSKKNPLPLKVGYWTSHDGKTTPFFTGREGEFFIEGIDPSQGRIQLDDEDFEAREINLEKSKRGLIDIGEVVLPYKESHL
jgi:outer membrane usher protein